MSDHVFIPINRRKMILMTVVYGVLGLFAFFVTYYLGESQDWVSPTVFKTLSVVVLLFFMVVAGTFAKNIKKANAGLQIDHTGINDQSSSISLGLIKWKDIKGISKVTTVSSKLILVTVKKPQVYIDNASNGAIKRLLNQNQTLYKTPVVINVGVLSTSIEELEEILTRYSEKFGKKK